MPSKNILPKNNEKRTSGCLKATPAMQPEQGVKCPRCDSTNTKFCYYNNYSSTQPRYFCKGCRRYWTKGGALRTIPFGGGSRRRKFMKWSNSRLGMGNDHSGSGLDLFQDFNMDFQLATPASATSSMGQELNFTLSSIESMSSINQDLYWKLQQQRLAMLFGGQNNNNNNNNNNMHNNNTVQQEDTSFIPYLPLQNNTQKSASAISNLIQDETSVSQYNLNSLSSDLSGASDHRWAAREGENGNLVTEWLFDSYYATVEPVAVDNCCSDRGIIEGTGSWINVMQGWDDFNKYGLIMP